MKSWIILIVVVYIIIMIFFINLVVYFTGNTTLFDLLHKNIYDSCILSKNDIHEKLPNDNKYISLVKDGYLKAKEKKYYISFISKRC